ncbi:phage tail protein I [Brachymonas chironomi]|uniref:phage tail protein I n=1 Tax=Brachymonas chironomi TaxID=491919 RepID=UPI0003712FDE|nr:phage tail protein I [Brachymonas chironomi]
MAEYQSLLVPPLRLDESSRALDKVAADRMDALPLSAALIYDFDRVHASALPALGAQFNLLGDAGWDFAGFSPAPEKRKRALLKEAVALHRLKGTRYAVHRSLQMLGVSARITEWWQPQRKVVPGAPAPLPYTFSIDLYLQDAVDGEPIVTPQRTAALVRMVNFWKPARSSFSVRVGIGMKNYGRSALVIRNGVRRIADLRPMTRHTAAVVQRTAAPIRSMQRMTPLLHCQTRHVLNPSPRLGMVIRPVQRLSVWLLPTGVST